jgi:hypothetical protein
MLLLRHATPSLSLLSLLSVLLHVDVAVLLPSSPSVIAWV